MSAERADPFTNIWRAGGIDTPQFSAAQRFVRDQLAAAGVREGDTWRPTPLDSGTGEPVSQAMVDAGRRAARVLAKVGIRDRCVLEAFARAMLRGEQLPWRELVRHETGVTERHRQGQVIEDVLENLRLGYDEMDREDARKRREDRERMAKVANDVRPVSATGGRATRPVNDP